MKRNLKVFWTIVIQVTRLIATVPSLKLGFQGHTGRSAEKTKGHKGAQLRVFQISHSHSHITEYLLHTHFIRENLESSYTCLQRRLGNGAVHMSRKWDLVAHILCHHKEKNKAVKKTEIFKNLSSPHMKQQPS